MKKIFLLFIVTLFTTTMIAQDFPTDRYKAGEVTWLGLDFTMGKLVDHAAFTDPYTLANSFLYKWNNIVIAEPGKYNIGEFLHLPGMPIDIKAVNAYNKEVDPETLVQNDFYVLKREDVISDAKKYKSTGLSGIGVVMYVEQYNKPAVSALYWFTLIDMATGEVLFIEKVSGKPGGFGVGNYWHGAFMNSLKSIDKKMKKWRK